jgi:hypothetical protein
LKRLPERAAFFYALLRKVSRQERGEAMQKEKINFLFAVNLITFEEVKMKHLQTLKPKY